MCSGEFQDEKVFGGGRWGVFLFEECEEFLEVLRILVREQGERLSGEAMRRGVPGDGGFAGVRLRSGGELAVCLVRENLCGGCQCDLSLYPEGGKSGCRGCGWWS